MRTILNVMCPEKKEKPVKDKGWGAFHWREWPRYSEALSP